MSTHCKNVSIIIQFNVSDKKLKFIIILEEVCEVIEPYAKCSFVVRSQCGN